MKIKVFEKTAGCFPEVFEIGEWYDLKVAEDVMLKAPHAKTLHQHKNNSEVVEKFRDVIFNYTLLPLGICMEIPDGYEAYVLPRSSTFKKHGIIQTNSEGIIDSSYCSEQDEWKMPVMATRFTTIPKGTRIAQFRIQLSQKATFWQKLKWLFSSSVKLEKVNTLKGKVRGGFGAGTDTKA